MIMDTSTEGLAAVMGLVTVITIFGLIWLILTVIANWKIFEKAGEAGWKCLIPFYNMYTEYKFTWDGRIAFVFIAFTVISAYFGATSQTEPNTAVAGILSIMGLAATVIDIIQSIRLAKAFGKGIGFAIGLILLEPIFRVILGFGGAQYVGKVDESKLC